MRFMNIISGGCLALLVLASAATARERSQTLTDANFGCQIPASALRAWIPNGYALPRGVGGSFRLWRSSDGGRGPLPSECRRLPQAKFIIGSAGSGNVTRFDLVVAQRDVPIYRAYTKAPFKCGGSRPAAKLGSWWSLSDPMHKAVFRRRNAICRQWNNLTLKTRCILKSGTAIAVGPTQSARCAQETSPECPKAPSTWPASFAATNEPQVFLNVRGRPEAEIAKFLTNCQTYTWRGRE